MACRSLNIKQGKNILNNTTRAITGLFLSFNLIAAIPANALESLQERSGYSIGYNYANSLQQQGIDLDPNSFVQGFKDSFSKANPAISQEQMQKAIEELQMATMAKQAAEQKALGEENKAKGQKFLAENKTKPGVITTASGLQYKVIKAGSGASPKVTDTVTTHYRGTLISGAEFDSSYKRNQPASFPVNGVIPGWTEALQLMKVGAKWQLFIPAELAYGSQAPRGSIISPNSTLIFDIELLEIKK